MASDLQKWCALTLKLTPPPSLELLKVLHSTPQAASLWDYLSHYVYRPDQIDIIRKNLQLRSGIVQHDREEVEKREEMEGLREELKRVKERAGELEGELQKIRRRLYRKARLDKEKEQRCVNDAMKMSVFSARKSRIDSMRGSIKQVTGELGALRQKIINRRSGKDTGDEPRFIVKDVENFKLQTEAEAAIEDAVIRLKTLATSPSSSASKVEELVDDLAKSLKLSEMIDILNRKVESGHAGGGETTAGLGRALVEIRKKSLRELRKNALASFIALEKLMQEMNEKEKIASSKMTEKGAATDADKQGIIVVGEQAALDFVNHLNTRLTNERNDTGIIAEKQIARTKNNETKVLEERISRVTGLMQKGIKQNEIIVSAVKEIEVDYRQTLKEQLLKEKEETLYILTKRTHRETEKFEQLRTVDPELDSRVEHKSKRLLVSRLRVIKPSSVGRHFSQDLDDHMILRCWNICEHLMKKRFYLDAQRHQIVEGKQLVQLLRGQSKLSLNNLLKTREQVLKTWGEPLTLEHESLVACLEKGLPAIEHDMQVWWTRPVRKALQGRTVKGKPLEWYEDRFRKLYLT